MPVPGHMLLPARPVDAPLTGSAADLANSWITVRKVGTPANTAIGRRLVTAGSSGLDFSWDYKWPQPTDGTNTAVARTENGPVTWGGAPR